ncbi:hypothetical protein [Methylobacterium aquaticum]|uniref:hypothetical protein n=1 Tax=Methylobacterium aquaticum TaxID=270351 RepID=UPI0019331090|nr:hypothetical protein [Methylobacterium aquaticum]QRE75080.1 hypothetical protein F1D61_17125 [Methylobacterium aquaticum]
MFETSSLAAAPPPAAIEPVMRIAPPPPAARGPVEPPLDPAVTFDLSPDARKAVARGTAAPTEGLEAQADRAHYRRDADSQQIVFQVIGPDGYVVEQLPSEAILRARTYAREAEAARSAEIGTSVARSA